METTRPIESMTLQPALEDGHVVATDPLKLDFANWNKQAVTGWVVMFGDDTYGDGEPHAEYVFIGEDAEAQARAYMATLPTTDNVNIEQIKLAFSFNTARIWWEMTFVERNVRQFNYETKTYEDPRDIWHLECVVRQEGQGDDYEFATPKERMTSHGERRIEVFIRTPREEHAVEEAVKIVAAHTGQKVKHDREY